VIGQADGDSGIHHTYTDGTITSITADPSSLPLSKRTNLTVPPSPPYASHHGISISPILEPMYSEPTEGEVEPAGHHHWSRSRGSGLLGQSRFFRGLDQGTCDREDGRQSEQVSRGSAVMMEVRADVLAIPILPHLTPNDTISTCVRVFHPIKPCRPLIQSYA
jgi:hypothetical protein